MDGADGGNSHHGSLPAGLLSFLVVLFFLNLVSRLSVGPLLPVIESEFGFRHGSAGALYFFITLGYCVGLFLSSYVACWLSHRRTIALSGFTLGSALLAIPYAPSLPWIRADLWLLGIGSGLYLPSGVAVLTENTPERSWGKALAIHELGPNLGYICAPLLVEFLLGFFGWRGVLRAMGGPTVLVSGLFLLSGLGGSARAQMPGRAILARLAIDRTFWGMACLFSVSIGVGLGLYTMMPLFLVNAAGMTRGSANLATGLSRMSALGSVFLAGVLADRIGRSQTVRLALGAAGVCAVLLGVLRGPWCTPLLLFLQAAAAASFYPAGFSLLSSVFPLPVRHVAISMVMVFASFVGAGGVPPSVGYLADHFSFSFAFCAAGLATLASVFLLGFAPSRARSRRSHE
jgi:MFS transporter, NNP family, nitrate/nitrite transporter